MNVDATPVVRRHFPLLEGLRAVAALAVFAHHIGFWTGASFASTVGPVLARLDVGVPIFFAISGFLLFRRHAVALLEDRAEPDRESFWWKRFWRIYPVYWVVLTVVLVLPRLSVKPPWTDLPLHYLLVQIYPTDKFFEGISQSWSLAVEVSFYLLLPFATNALRPLMRNRPQNQRALRLLAVMAGLVAASTLFRTAVFSFTDGDAFRMIFWLPGTLDYFAIGMAAAVIHVWGERQDAGRRVVDALSGSAWPWWLLAGTALLIASTGLDLEPGLGRASWHIELFRQVAYGVVALGVLVPAVFGTGGAIRALLGSAPMRWFGAISYSFYLWHLAVIEWFFDATGRDLFLNWDDLSIFSGEVIWVVAATLAGTTALSALTYYAVEAPVNARSRRSGRATAPTSETTSGAAP